MVKSTNQPTEFTDNTHRSLKRLVVVDAWFRRSRDNPSRYTLHADISFNIERLSGGSASAVTFKVAVKQCEVVFIRPLDGFSVDRSSVRRQKPMGRQNIEQKKQKKASAGFHSKLGLSRRPTLEAGAEADVGVSSEHSVDSKQSKSFYNEQFTRSREGHDAWTVNGEELGGHLTGPVFDVEAEPRLTLIDIREEARRQRDEAHQLTPVTRIEIRCLREDIDIHDVKLKDEARAESFFTKPGSKERMQIARGVLREALIAEGLSVGQLLDDPYAEMTICDATIPILDQSS
ncbi:hypothetical protein [Paracoccus fistulariae]|uniref:Uncharacterized protein n=1 Tax=Paracoccus fistulariae TaxID=658446 RepID=A0ABY7SQM4_9RHOB|nr:hypothetical protein [Paracoccus fistulariae]MDB6183116.1 hypothetical protein [Paracoccus fistulariae]WCR08813.1 hypothetical protein JHX87_08500 [Paracoccus fistulariae]